ncbi:MAG: phenylalanine--tRNA ligase subunit alpha, partial [Treponema sp.]|nr:phenylalanine--tRNA ligase subunit alpha [Treponema sp.]
MNYKKTDRLTSERLQKELGYKEGHSNQAFSWLSGKNLLTEIERVPHVYYELTDFGRKVAEEGSAEERIVAFLNEKGPHTMQEIADALGLESKDVGSAFGSLKKEGVLTMGADAKAECTGTPLPPRIEQAKNLIARALDKENAVIESTELSLLESQIMQGLTKKRGI